MGYDRNTKTIVAPVGLHDIAEVLGGSVDFANVNPWAKYKPVSGYDTPKPLTEQQRKAKNQGLYIPYFTTIKDMFDAMIYGTYNRAANYKPGVEPWSYISPKDDKYKRVLDFDGYYKEAKAFANPCRASVTYLPIDNALDLVAVLRDRQDYLIKPSDLVALLGDEVVSEMRYVGIAHSSQLNYCSAVAQDDYSRWSERKRIHNETYNVGKGAQEHTVFINSWVFLSRDKIDFNGTLYPGYEEQLEGTFIPVPATLSRSEVRLEGMSATYEVYDPIMAWQKIETPSGVNAGMCFDLLVKFNGNFTHRVNVKAYQRASTSHSSLWAEGEFEYYAWKGDGESTGQMHIRVTMLSRNEQGGIEPKGYMELIGPDGQPEPEYNPVPLTILGGSIFSGEPFVEGTLPAEYISLGVNYGNDRIGWAHLDYEIWP